MSWQDELDNAYKEYVDRGKFSYDPQTDAGYKQYEQAYLKLGRQAMKDTQGQAAALTGGYGNSYATTAGAQQYMNYAGQAAQAIPTFQNMALQQYQVEGDNILNRYNMAADGRNFDYQKERDAVADSHWQQEFSYQQSRDAIADSHWQKEFDSTYNRWLQEFQYQQSRDKVSDAQWQKQFDSTYNRWLQEFNYQKSRDTVSDAQWQQNMNYQKSRDAVSDSQWNKTFAYQQSRDAVADSQWQQTFNYQKQKDAADRAYKNAASKSNGTGKTATQEASFDPKKYKYGDWLDDYVEAVKTNGLKDAGTMLSSWLDHKYITPDEFMQMRDYVQRNVIPNMTTEERNRAYQYK